MQERCHLDLFSVSDEFTNRRRIIPVPTHKYGDIKLAIPCSGEHLCDQCDIDAFLLVDSNVDSRPRAGMELDPARHSQPEGFGFQRTQPQLEACPMQHFL